MEGFAWGDGRREVGDEVMGLRTGDGLENDGLGQRSMGVDQGKSERGVGGCGSYVI
jgi:hypothetical protein